MSKHRIITNSPLVSLCDPTAGSALDAAFYQRLQEDLGLRSYMFEGQELKPTVRAALCDCYRTFESDPYYKWSAESAVPQWVDSGAMPMRDNPDWYRRNIMREIGEEEGEIEDRASVYLTVHFRYAKAGNPGVATIIEVSTKQTERIHGERDES